MILRRAGSVLAVFTLFLSLSPFPGGAQGVLERLGRRAVRLTEAELSEALAKKVEGATQCALDNAGTERAAMLPNATFRRGKALEFHVNANQRRRGYISDIVVAVHGEPLYDALTTGDRVFTTRGILFDFDSNRIRGESTPTLEDILRILEEHPDLTVAIEGHTDAVGDDDYNQELSERRAQAVVDYLVNAGIDPPRLRAEGFGESQPVGDNETEAGRKQNRRVAIRNLAGGG